MATEYYSLGELLPGLSADRLQYEESKLLLSACQHHSAFDVVELRRLEIKGDLDQIPQHIDGIVVECCDGTVPSHSPMGVKNRERLLLLHGPGLLTPHEVCALRTNFPVTPHQNSVPDGDPFSLCLYFEPWSAVERTWTPARHLQRILWWLRETAFGTLHRSDQPLERLHFVSPYQIVLPADFKERAETRAESLSLTCVGSRRNSTVFRGEFQSRGLAKMQDDGVGFDALIVIAPAIVSKRIERYPTTLGALHDQLAQYGSELLSPLIDAAKNVISSAGLLIKGCAKHTLLLLQVPVARGESDAPERIDVSGFIICDISLARLGIACGAYLDGRDGKVYENRDLGINSTVAIPVDNRAEWQQFVLYPVDIRLAFSLSDVRRASGVSTESAEFLGVLAGVGALGSSMAELWSREGWGSWSYIDDDILHAHNIVRHVGKDPHIGCAKVDVMSKIAELNWPTVPKPKAIAAKVNDIDNAEVNDALLDASLFVDATTTLEVPRDLSDRDGTPRMASVFITPSGRDSVLFLEDAERNIRLSSLEAQYYRAILNRDWGEKHLVGHLGAYWVGAGCRDLSGVLSQEVVQLYGAMLARQIRLLSAQPEAQIRVCSMNDESGALAVDIIPVAVSLKCNLGVWNVVWDEGLEKKLRELRAACLPNETGGVVLGYVDQKRKAIQIVDVLPAPSDSEASLTGFTRGVNGVKEAIERASALTANIVSYLGEWHSHPRHTSAAPSAEDAVLLAYLTEILAMDGLPALMVIVGETATSISLGKGVVE